MASGALVVKGRFTVHRRFGSWTVRDSDGSVARSEVKIYTVDKCARQKKTRTAVISAPFVNKRNTQQIATQLIAKNMTYIAPRLRAAHAEHVIVNYDRREFLVDPTWLDGLKPLWDRLGVDVFGWLHDTFAVHSWRRFL